MAVIQYSGNADNPDSFSQHDMNHLIKTHNETIDAIIFVLNYTERSTKAAFEKSLEMRGIDNFEYFTDHPANKLISCLGMANDVQKRDTPGSYNSFSPFLSIKIRNAISEYEETYAELGRRVGKLHWAFQTDMIFAFDKLCAETKKFKSKYKHVVGLHKIIADLEKHIQKTAQIIGSPEIEWFNGSLTMAQAISVREKLNAAQTPIYPLHMYRDIMRLRDAQEKVQTTKHDRSRSSHYKNAHQNALAMSDKNVELSEANLELARRNAELSADNSHLLQEKQQLIEQVAALQRGFFRKIALKLAQRKK